MPGLGYAYAVYPKMIDQSLKRRIFVNAQDNKFVQCVSPNTLGSAWKAGQFLRKNWF